MFIPVRIQWNTGSEDDTQSREECESGKHHQHLQYPLYPLMCECSPVKKQDRYFGEVNCEGKPQVCKPACLLSSYN